MPKTELLIGAGLAALGLTGLYVFFSRRAPDEPDVPVCKTAPPGPYPPVPSGWSIYRGPVSALAASVAGGALSLPMGSAHSFNDEDGSLVGVLVTWHCHDPSEGVKPVGWHKGVTLFRVG